MIPTQMEVLRHADGWLPIRMDLTRGPGGMVLEYEGKRPESVPLLIVELMGRGLIVAQAVVMAIVGAMIWARWPENKFGGQELELLLAMVPLAGMIWAVIAGAKRVCRRRTVLGVAVMSVLCFGVLQMVDYYNVMVPRETWVARGEPTIGEHK